MLAATAPFVLPVPGESFVQPFKAGYGLRLTGATSGYVGLKPAAAAGSTNFTLPSADAAGCWVSDGAGNLSLETASQTRTRLGLGATDDPTFGDLVVDSLTILNPAVIINSTTLHVADPLIKLGVGNPSDLLDLGFYGTYTATGSKYAGLFRDATDGKFKLFTALEAEPTTTVNTSGTGYAGATLVVGTIEATTYVGYPATNPAGSGTEVQYRAGASTFGAVTGSSFAGGVITLPDLTVRSLGLDVAPTGVSGEISSAALKNITLRPGTGYLVGYGTSGDSYQFHPGELLFTPLVNSILACNTIGGNFFFKTNSGSGRITRVTIDQYGTTTFQTGENVAAKTLIVKAMTSQTGSLQEWQTSAGAIKATMYPSGKLYLDNAGGDTVFSGNPVSGNAQIVGYSGYWAIRTGASLDFNVDTYNSGSVLNALKVAQTGATTLTSPAATPLTLVGAVGAAVSVVRSVATNDDPEVTTYQNRVATTDATVTTLHTIAVADNTTYTISATVECRCTGGAGGNSGKAARFDFISRVRRSGGIALLGTVTAIYTDQDGTAWAATFDVDGGNNARIRVTGGATDNITWHVVELKVSPLST